MAGKPDRRTFVSGSLALATFGALPSAQAAADDYPSAPIKLIVSVAPGGGNDVIARIMSFGLQRTFGQTIVVENRPGAGNNIAAEFVYRAPADGYTLLVSPPAPLVVNAALFKSLRFEPDKLEPVAITSYIPNVLVVNVASPFQTAKDFIAYAKANPGKLSYASQGIGTTGHLTGALFEQLTGSPQSHVPYGGAAPALNDLAGAHVDFMFADLGSVIPLAKGGLLRMLAVLTEKTTPVAPELPTIAEAGMPELLSDTWTAFTAPPGTSLAIREKLATAMREIIFAPDVKSRLDAIGVVPWGLDPQQSAELIKRETKRWTAVAERAHVTVQ